MTVAAANKNWFPAAFGTVGQVGTYKLTKGSANEENADEAMDKGESPMYAAIPHPLPALTNNTTATP